jgi:hypothetical protein
MRRRRPLFALTLLAALALILPVSLPADAEPSGPTTPQEYVVVYTGSAAQAEKAIEAAGGQVVDLNEDAKIAKVSTTESGFVAKADRATDTVSCAKIAGSSAAFALKNIRPPPFAAMSSSSFASESFAVPRPITLTVTPAARISASSFT